MRVLFLSDTHLGFDLPGRPRVARRRRGDDFFENFARALAPAARGGVDVVVHGGDLLYRSRVPAWLAEAALSPLRRLAAGGVPVLLVPGNHERSRVPYPLLAVEEGLHVFDRPRAVLVEARGLRAAFIGFPYTSRVRHRFAETYATAARESLDADVHVLCLHQCIEGATCGPGNFTFRSGPDVIRAADLPRHVVATLCGHVHRHQVLQPPGRAPVIYAGSIERTSFAEAPEPKGFVLLELSRSGLARWEFQPLPTRPMVVCRLDVTALDAVAVESRVIAALESTPPDAVVQLRITGASAWLPRAETLRRLAAARTVTLAVPRGWLGRRRRLAPGGH